MVWRNHLHSLTYLINGALMSLKEFDIITLTGLGNLGIVLGV
jgi:hypothetical protein